MGGVVSPGVAPAGPAALPRQEFFHVAAPASLCEHPRPPQLTEGEGVPSLSLGRRPQGRPQTRKSTAP